MLREWGPRHLVAAWVVYWVLLIVVAGFPAIREYVTLQLSDGHGTVSWSFAGSATEAALWLCGPPLALAAVWFWTRTRR
jgi:hypothetical protein